jgi:hypothetical protein
MKKSLLSVAVVVATVTFSLAQSAKQLVSFDQLFPQAQQRSMGMHKLTAQEKEALRAHVEELLVQIASSSKAKPSASKGAGGGTVYAGVGGGH